MPSILALFILLGTFLTLGSFANGSPPPGILTFTVTNLPHRPNTKVFAKFLHFIDSRPHVTFEPTEKESNKFSVNWANIAEDRVSSMRDVNPEIEINLATADKIILRDALIQVDIAYVPDVPEDPSKATGTNRPSKAARVVRIIINLNDYSYGQLRQLYAGGKANIVISGNGLSLSAKIEFVEDLNGKRFVPPEVLIFNVEYDRRKGKKVLSVQNVEVNYSFYRTNAAAPGFYFPLRERCQPLYDDTKFALDLADCKVYDTLDLAEFKFVVTFRLQHVGSSGSELETREVIFRGLMERPEHERQQFYEGGMATIVFNDNDQSRIYHHNGPNEASTSSGGQGVKSAGWIGPTEIAFSVDHSHDDRVVQLPNGKLSVVSRKVKTIKLVNDKAMKMRKKEGEGPECPLKIIENFEEGKKSALLQIDWQGCKPTLVEEFGQLEGMELNIIYQLDNEEPIEAKYKLKRSDPIKMIFAGNLRIHLTARAGGTMKLGDGKPYGP